MIYLLELLGYLIIGAVGVAVTVITLWFVVGMIIAFWKVYVRGPVGGLVPKKRKKCKHSNSTYTEKHPDLVWECNDCGELHK